MKELIEGKHYYINESGYVVLTEQYHIDLCWKVQYP